MGICDWNTVREMAHFRCTVPLGLLVWAYGRCFTIFDALQIWRHLFGYRCGDNEKLRRFGKEFRGGWLGWCCRLLRFRIGFNRSRSQNRCTLSEVSFPFILSMDLFWSSFYSNAVRSLNIIMAKSFLTMDRGFLLERWITFVKLTTENCGHWNSVTDLSCFPLANFSRSNGKTGYGISIQHILKKHLMPAKIQH